MMVEFTTNLPCPTERTAPYLGIAYGGDENAVETIFTEVFNGRQCDDQTGVLGTYAFRPLPADREQTIFLRAALAPAGDVEAFCSPKDSSFDARRCVIARRRIRFTPGATLRVPLLFHDSCLGKPCEVNETCVVGGRCVSKILITPTCRPNETCVVEIDAGVGAAAGGGSAGGGSAAGGSAGGGAASGGSASGGSASGGSASGGSASGGSASGGSASGGSASGGSASGGSASGGSASGGFASGGSASGGSASGGSASGGSASGGSASGGSASGGSAAGGTAGVSGGSAAGGSAGGSSDAGASGCNVYQQQFCGGSLDAGCCLSAGIDAGIGLCSANSTCTQVGMSSGLLVRCIKDTDCGGQSCWVRDNQTLCIATNLPNTLGDRRTCAQMTACTDLGMPDCNPDPIFPFVKTCQCNPLDSHCSSEEVCSPATRQCVPRGAPAFVTTECRPALPGQQGMACLQGRVCCLTTIDQCLEPQIPCPAVQVGCRSSSECASGSWCSYDQLSSLPFSARCLNGIEAREACNPAVSSARNCEGGGVCNDFLVVQIGGVDSHFGFCQ